MLYILLYYPYLLLCWLSHPFRWLIPGYTHENFAIKLLFWNEYKVCWVVAQSQFETGNYTSNLYKNFKNCFGMGYVASSWFQRGAFFSPLKGEPSQRAKYWSVYSSIFDYYVLCRKRKPAYGRALDDVPPQAFSVNSDAVRQYLDYTASKFHSLGYYLADYHTYSVGVQNYGSRYVDSTVKFSINAVLTCVVPAVLLIPFKGSESLAAKGWKRIKQLWR